MIQEKIKVINEESVASGIRRIEAITGSVAINELNKKYDYYKELELKLNLRDQDIIDKINNILLENKTLKNENLNFLSKAKESEINMFLKSKESVLGSYLFCFDNFLAVLIFLKSKYFLFYSINLCLKI